MGSGMGSGMGLGRFSSISPFGMGSKFPQMPPNPVAQPQTPQVTPASTQGVMQAMKTAFQVGEAHVGDVFLSGRGSYGRGPGLRGLNVGGAEPGYVQYLLGREGKTVAAEDIRNSFSARMTHEGRSAATEGSVSLWTKRAEIAPPTMASMQPVNAATVPTQPPPGLPAPGMESGMPPAGVAPGTQATGGQPQAQAPMGGAMPAGAPAGAAPPTLGGTVPPMGMPPTPPLPANPRMTPPRMPNRNDLMMNQGVNGLLDAGAAPSLPGEGPEEIRSDLMAIGGKTAGSLDALFLGKQALHVDQGGGVSKALANTIGRVNALPLLAISGKALNTPNEEKHQELGKRFDSASDGALKDTVLRLGGTNMVDDILWKKEHGDEKLKWHQRIGGRTWQNPKTSLPGKALGTLAVPLADLFSSLRRSPHYNTLTDVAHQFTDEPAIAEHELGHAMDFNTMYGLNPGESPHKGVKGWLHRQGKGLLHDGYALGTNAPGLNLWPEAMANINAVNLHQKSKHMMPEDEAREHEIRQVETLPASYGSYVGGATGIGGLAGMLGGKAFGLLAGKSMRESDATKKKEQDQPPKDGDGDGDGKVKDHTPEEQPAKAAFDLKNVFEVSGSLDDLFLGKQAAQDDDGSINPVRSATGESKGLKFAPSYDGHGLDAWDSVGNYFKGGKNKKPNPFIGKHASGDEIAYKGFLAEGHSPEEADRLAGEPLFTVKQRGDDVQVQDHVTGSGEALHGMLGKIATDYSQRLVRLAMRRHPGTPEQAMAAFNAEFPKSAGAAARREGESREDWLSRLALPEEQFKEAKAPFDDFGRAVARQAITSGGAGTAVGGGILGGALGLASGLTNPGQDEKGQQRSRWIQALKRGLTYGAAGAMAMPVAAGAGLSVGNHIYEGQQPSVDKAYQQGLSEYLKLSCDKAAGFDQLELEALKKRSLSRRSNGMLRATPSRTTTAPAPHTQRVNTPAAMHKLSSDERVKCASTALVRAMLKGLLSPQSVQRAARAMQPGKFRFVQNLGRGQFSLADKVVGNMGGRVGEMVRKLPTRQVASAGGEMHGVKRLIEELNGRFGAKPLQQAVSRVMGKGNVADPIAPYVHVGDKGAFQAMATGRVPHLPKQLTDGLTDLHPGNVGPKGQIFDFGLKADNALGAGAGISPMKTQFGQQFIDPLSGMGNRASGMDIFANIGANSQPATRAALEKAVPQSNNLIRRYWGASPQARPGVVEQAQQTVAPRAQGLVQNIVSKPSPGRTPLNSTFRSPAQPMQAPKPIQVAPTTPPPPSAPTPTMQPKLQPAGLAPTNDFASMHSMNPYAKAAMDKLAGWWDQGLKALMTGGAKAVPAAVKAAPRAMAAQVPKAYQAAKTVVSNPAVRTQVARNATQSGAGAMVGGFSGEAKDTNWKLGPMQFNPDRALAGAVAFNPMIRNAAKRAPGVGRNAAMLPLDATKGGLIGEMGGGIADYVASPLGHDTNFREMGKWTGAAMGGGNQGLRAMSKFVPQGSMAQTAISRTLGYGRPVAKGMDQFARAIDDPFVNLMTAPVRKGVHALYNTGGKATGKTLDFLGGANQRAPQRWFGTPSKSIPQLAGRAVGYTGLGAGGVLLGDHMANQYAGRLAGNAVGEHLPHVREYANAVVDENLNHVMHSVDQYAQNRIPQFADAMQGEVTGRMPGIVNDFKNQAIESVGAGDIGKLIGNLTGQAGGNLGGMLGNAGSGLMAMGDKALSAFGLDPSKMSGMQKLMLFGGLLSAGGGMLGGSGTMAGLGGGTALLSLLPYFLQSEQGQRLLGQMQNQPAGQPQGQGGQGPGQTPTPQAGNVLGARNEFQHQQNLQQGQQQQTPDYGRQLWDQAAYAR